MAAAICVICRQGDCNFVTRCRHNFHDNCLKMWLVENEDCPTCRGHVSADKDVERMMAEGINKDNLSKLGLKQVDEAFKWCLEKGEHKYLLLLVDRKIELGWNINSVVSDGACLIHLTAKLGSLELLNHLVQKGVDLKKRDQISGSNCLLYAAEGGETKIIGRLLKLKMSVNSDNNIGETALHIACKNQNFDLVIYLLSKGANIQATTVDKSTPLHYATASKTSSIEIVDYLISKGAKMDALNAQDEAPIEGTIIYGRMDIFNLFVKKGLCIASNTTLAYNLFKRAIAMNRVDFMKRICDLGADYCVDMISASQGANFLHMSAGHGNYEATAFLIKERTFIDWPMLNGETPIFLACSQGHAKIVECFIKSGATVNVRDFSGKTPLDYAFKSGKLEIARMLLATGKFSKK